jgi:hypothetical protein
MRECKLAILAMMVMMRASLFDITKKLYVLTDENQRN